MALVATKAVGLVAKIGVELYAQRHIGELGED
jgi:hypothetical protein